MSVSDTGRVFASRLDIPERVNFAVHLSRFRRKLCPVPFRASKGGGVGIAAGANRMQHDPDGICELK